ncbi:CbiX/SirB N-terminal domain-containing protein [Chitinimonas sp.]|uniref:sirohydrochlorin chelatase n=1 Tax=Chitinimonas sp. TaxID=1934313 RepID=UPI002F9334D4
MSAPAIILFAHGARDPLWAQPFERLATLVAARWPGSPVQLAYLELMSPNLSDCVTALFAEGHRHILVSPIFMARGAHLRRDLPALLDALRAQHPGLSLEATEAVGEVEALQEAMADWIVQRAGG